MLGLFAVPADPHQPEKKFAGWKDITCFNMFEWLAAEFILQRACLRQSMT
jgi:hypothetical protein